MSFGLRPFFYKSYGIAAAGPIPIMLGGTPATVQSMNLAKIGKPNFLATDLLAKRTAAAPSVTYDELPAVVDPSFPKAGFNFDNPS